MSDESFEMSKENGGAELFNSGQYKTGRLKDSIIEFTSGEQGSDLINHTSSALILDTNRTLNNQTEEDHRPCLTEQDERSQTEQFQVRTQSTKHNQSMMKEQTEGFVMQPTPARKRTAAFRFNPLRNITSPARTQRRTIGQTQASLKNTMSRAGTVSASG